MSRRSFLAAMGLAAGALAVPGASLAARLGAAPLGAAGRWGVALPASKTRPLLAEQFLAGLALPFREAGTAPPDMVVRRYPGGPGVGAVQQLIEQDGARLVVAVLNPRVLSHLIGLLERHRAVLVAAGAGANAVTAAERHPRVFHSTLGYWQANLAMGAWAARNLGRRAFVAQSLQESGYDAPYAFRHGFEAAGGRVVGLGVSHRAPGGGDLGSTLAAARRVRPDFVYALYGGRQAVDFLRAYAEAGLAGTVPLAGSASLVDEGVLARHGAAVAGITSAVTWAAGLEGAANRALVADASRAGRHVADAWAVLGHDTARWIQEAAGATGPLAGPLAGAFGLGADLETGLRRAAFTGPRGAMAATEGMQSLSGPIFLSRVELRGGVPVNAVRQELGRTGTADRQADDLRPVPRSGWIDPYGVL